MMKKLILLVLLLQSTGFSLQAEEGMWIPLLLEQLNIKQMQEMGLRLTAEDIYNVNHSSLKDAIVQFGGGCTAEIVSQEGLLLTNHHCGLGAIQRLSSLEHDYLANGFWAKSKEEELPSPGTTVTLLVRMEDVTEKALIGVDDKMSQFVRAQILKQNIELLEKEAIKGTSYEAKIRSFYYGNQYYLFVFEVFKDVRLVGTPPSSVAQFGGDSDNWMWPRHGGDFSVFRIYTDKNNNPANYSKDNVPYKPKKFLSISLKGYQKGDFTFVFGYPGTTREYLTSYGVDLTANKENPVRINLRQQRLDIMNAAINESKQIRIQYISKHQGIANGWKKMIGETKGIERMNGIAIKQDFEAKFQVWADSVSRQQSVFSGKQSGTLGGNRSYTGLLPEFEKTYREYLPVDLASVYLTEAGMGIEIVRFAMNFKELIKVSKDKNSKQKEVDKLAANLLKTSKNFFKDYQPTIDKKVMVVLLQSMKKNMETKYLPEIFKKIDKKFHSDFSSYTNDLFNTSIFTDSLKLYQFLCEYKSPESRIIFKDPAYQLALSISSENELILVPATAKFTGKIDSLQRIYMSAQMEMQKNKRFYPDANSTLRISYGKVDDYNPADAIHYSYFTTSTGILQKEDSTIYDYKVDSKLKRLFITHDFGRYADKDRSLHIAFTGSNHTTGGNSGSPVLDADGYLIGLNFDRNWEGTMSDLMYDANQCRNISLDIRYCLFIIDKYAGAENLIKEMKIAE